MTKTFKTFGIFSAMMISVILTSVASSQSQMPLPVYVARTPVVAVPAGRSCCQRACYSAVVPVQVNYPAYYAPQVPVVPMAYGPVPTMSAYYVPTVPVAHAYYANVVPARRVRRYAIPVAPTMIHPVYWLPY